MIEQITSLQAAATDSATPEQHKAAATAATELLRSHMEALAADQKKEQLAALLTLTKTTLADTLDTLAEKEEVRPEPPTDTDSQAFKEWQAQVEEEEALLPDDELLEGLLDSTLLALSHYFRRIRVVLQWADSEEHLGGTDSIRYQFDAPRYGLTNVLHKTTTTEQDFGL